MLLAVVAAAAACSQHSTTPSAQFTVVVGAEQNVIPPGSAGLEFTPDEHLSYRHRPDGTYDMWVSGGGTIGTLGFNTPDLLALTSMRTVSGVPAGVFVPAGPGTTAFDADYAGAGSVFPAANGTDLLMIYHAENHLFSGVDYAGSPFYAGIGLARSTDGGQTWTREGEIIAGHDAQQPTQQPSGAGALTPAAIESGGYIYVLFREIDLQSHVSGLCIARAPVASDGAPGSWQKYDQGSFSTPGLGGTVTPLALTLDPASIKDQRQPSVSYNAYLGSFAMVVVGNGGIYLATSQDLIHWSAGRVIVPAPVPDATVTPSTEPFNWYPTLVTPADSSDEVTGQAGYLYYAKGLGDGTAHHFMYRRPFTITRSAP